MIVDMAGPRPCCRHRRRPTILALALAIIDWHLEMHLCVVIDERGVIDSTAVSTTPGPIANGTIALQVHRKFPSVGEFKSLIG